MRGVVFVLVLEFVAIASCAPPNTSLVSFKNSDDFEFSKHDTITVLLPDEPTPTELHWISLVKDALQMNGFLVVDSMSHANKVLDVKITKNVFFSTKDLRYVNNYQVGALDPTPETFDIGSSSLSLHIYEAGLLKKDGCYPIWFGSLCTENDFLNKYPAELLTLILKNYGMNNKELLTFKPTGK